MNRALVKGSVSAALAAFAVVSGVGCATSSVVSEMANPVRRQDMLRDVRRAHSDGYEFVVSFRAALRQTWRAPESADVRDYWLSFSKNDILSNGRLSFETDAGRQISVCEMEVSRSRIRDGRPPAELVSGLAEIPVLRTSDERKAFYELADRSDGAPAVVKQAALMREKTAGPGSKLVLEAAECLPGSEQVMCYRVFVQGKRDWTESCRAAITLPFALVVDALFLPFELIFRPEAE